MNTTPRAMMLTIAALFGGSAAIDGAHAVPVPQDTSTIILPGGDGSGYSDEFISGYLSYLYLSPLMNFMSSRVEQVAYCDTSTRRYLTRSGDDTVPAETYYQNQLFYQAKTATCSNPVVRPNTDDLYVIGQFDLSKGPVRITHPAMYFYAKPGETESPASYSLQFVDPWTDTFFHVSPWGTGPTSTTEGSIDPDDPDGGDFSAGTYYLYHERAPYAADFEANANIPDAALIKSEYSWVWMLGRIEIPFDDLEKTRVLCRDMTSTSYEWVPGEGLVQIDLNTADWPENPLQTQCTDPGPHGQIGYGVSCTDLENLTQESAITYLTKASESLQYASIPEPGFVDEFYQRQLDKIGVNPEIGGPLNVNPPLSQAALEEIYEGFKLAKNLGFLCGSSTSDTSDALESLGFLKDNTWVVPPRSTGNYDQKIVLRAYIAQLGLGADVRTYEYYPTASKYPISNPAPGEPSSEPFVSVKQDGTTNEFIVTMDTRIDEYCSDWSLTMYATDEAESTASVVCQEYNASCDGDGDNCVVAVGTDHLTYLGQKGAIKTESDDGRSCYRILLSPDEPDPTSDPTLNWLPSPTGYGTDTAGQEVYFQITLRIFNAKFAGPFDRYIPGWRLPCIRKLESGTSTDCSACEQTSAGCIGDLVRDGRVDAADLATVFAAWGSCDGCPEDLNGDGIVDSGDLGDLFRRWGPCP